jgi:hypothetical protein
MIGQRGDLWFRAGAGTLQRLHDPFGPRLSAISNVLTVTHVSVRTFFGDCR